jgi:RNA polymerase sigma-70 factor (ECF subfamily)
MAESRFQTTRWSVVLQARDSTQTSARGALAALFEAYGYPLYCFARRTGADPEEALDLIQGYFTRFLEKDFIHDVHRRAGRFRSFLLASLKHYIANERCRSATIKRGGRATVVSFDSRSVEERYELEPVESLTPEMVYERRWAQTVMDRTLDRLRRQAVSAGKIDQFDAFAPLVTGEGRQPPYREIAERLGMSEGAVKVAVHRLRRAFGAQLREEIAETVSGPTELDDEVRHLLQVLHEARSARG